jgi:hypothetical protein
MPGRTAPVHGKKNNVCHLFKVLIFSAMVNWATVKRVKNVSFIRVALHFFSFVRKQKFNIIMIDAEESANIF